MRASKSGTLVKARQWIRMLAFVAASGVLPELPAQETNPPAPVYHIYSGNTHSHTVYTWSHDEQWRNPSHLVVSNFLSHPGPQNVLKSNWQKAQGPPSAHFALASQAV
jgi:hypothetical protein